MSLWVTDAPSAVPALLTLHMVLALLLPTATPEQLRHLLPCTLAPAALQITEWGLLLLLVLVPEALAAGASTVCKVCAVTDEVW